MSPLKIEISENFNLSYIAIFLREYWFDLVLASEKKELGPKLWRVNKVDIKLYIIFINNFLMNIHIIFENWFANKMVESNIFNN